jgi:hypothetical protein
MPDKKLWLNNDNLVTANGKVLECDDCPCGCKADCCIPDYLILEAHTSQKININGIHVLPRWNGVAIPSPYTTGPRSYTMPYPEIGYWKYDPNSGGYFSGGTSIYVACANVVPARPARAGCIYMQLWDDAYSVGPIWEWWQNGNLCKPLTSYHNSYNGKLLDYTITPVFM